jgi:hypothetical protein
MVARPSHALLTLSLDGPCQREPEGTLPVGRPDTSVPAAAALFGVAASAAEHALEALLDSHLPQAAGSRPGAAATGRRC